MSILVKGIDMPQSCGDCHFLTYPFNVPVCSVTGEIFTIPYNRSLKQVLQERKNNCPLEEVTKEVRHGEWVDGKRMGFDGTFHWFRQCSECLYEREDDNPEKDTNYCPNCGALMVDEEEDIPMEYFENGGI